MKPSINLRYKSLLLTCLLILSAGAVAPNATVEIVKDITLGKGECLIETEGGIFDCGLGTQLSELRQKLKLLSYEG